jgi:hypothetical protein
MNERKNIIIIRALCISVLLSIIFQGAAKGQITGALITGNFNVGSVLTGDTIGSPEPGNHVDYEWYYEDSTKIGPNDTYTIQPADEGRGIFVVAFERTGSNAIDTAIESSTTIVNSYPDVTYALIAGEARPGLTLYGIYGYSDADGDAESGTTFRWYRSSTPSGPGTVINLATGTSYKIKDSDSTYYIGFSVTPRAASGSTPGTEFITPVYTKVLSNHKPVATVSNITGPTDVLGVLTGHYVYSDYEGDAESGSLYQWSVCNTISGTYQNIPAPSGTGISYQITLADQGRYFKFSATPRAATGIQVGNIKTSTAIGPANSAPYAKNVYISGANTNILTLLTGNFQYVDVDSVKESEGTHLYQWYRGTEPIAGADDNTYTPGVEDVGSSLVFKVTPVTAGTGYPVIGAEVSSPSYGPITDPSAGTPTATQICIDGTRVKDNILKGRYLYTNKYKEKDSEYYWYSNGVLVGTGTYNASQGYSKYTLKESDLGNAIIFKVVPKNKLGTAGPIASSDSLAIFTAPLQNNFSITDPQQLLKANYTDGVFSGPGQSVSGKYFYPSALTVRATPYTLSYIHQIQYDSIQCTQTAFKYVTINAVVATISGVDPFYCDDHGLESVTILNLPASIDSCKFVLTDSKGKTYNVTKISNTSATFNPDLLGNENYTLRYSYFIGDPEYKAYSNFDIEHIGEVSIDNLKADTAFCNDSAPFQLYFSPKDGIFTTGPVLGSKLILGGLSGNAIVTYKVAKAHCADSAVVPIRINPAPVVSFAAKDSCILDINSDSTRMVVFNSSIDPVNSWQWIFTEGGVTTQDDKKNASYLFKTGGPKKIILTATTVNGCSVKREETIDLGVKPIADFTWEKDCYHKGSSIYFYDATTVDPNVTIKTRRWNINNGDSISRLENPVYPQPGIGAISVFYTVTTAYTGCDDSESKTVFIRPTVSLDKDYSENFETGHGDWIQGYESVNNWSFGTPDKSVIKGAASGINAWYTNLPSDTVLAEASSVISPCFDFTKIKRPMISIDMWKRLDRNHQGAVLQYKIGSTGSWEYAGSLSDGINWFNSALIKGRPGGGEMGWTSDTLETQYNSVKHKLEGLEGKTDVTFRIAYGSDGSTLRDGLAFDNIFIGSQTRKVLIEHFTNLSSSASSNTNSLADTIAGGNPQDVAYIQYHTNFPGRDSYYDANSGEASARILYYGLSRTPYSFIDGGSDFANYASRYDFSTSLAFLDSNEVARRSLINAPFDINLKAVATEGVLTVDAVVKARSDRSVKNLTLFIAVVEKENNDATAANGDNSFRNVFRKMIPDAGGKDLKKVWLNGDSVVIPDQSWMIENIKDNSKIEVIAFLQNNVTREVYQAASVPNIDIGTGINDTPVAGKLHFALYPNPAVNKLTINFGKPLTGNTDIRIYDLQGSIVSEFKTGTDRTFFTIDDLNLNQGIYLIRISQGGTDLGSRKLVITGR